MNALKMDHDVLHTLHVLQRTDTHCAAAAACYITRQGQVRIVWRQTHQDDRLTTLHERIAAQKERSQGAECAALLLPVFRQIIGLNPHLNGAALSGAEARGRVVHSQQRRVESCRQRRLDDPPAM